MCKLWGSARNRRLRKEEEVDSMGNDSLLLYKMLKKLRKIDRKVIMTMGVLDVLAAELEELKTDSAAVAARVAEDFAFLKAQIAELGVRVDELVAGQVDPVQLEGLQALVGEIGVTLDSIEDIPNPPTDVIVPEEPVV